MAINEDTNAAIKQLTIKTYAYPLLESVHYSLAPPCKGETLYTRGNFSYFHYGCDGQIDNGWGCGYRTLQSAASWIINKCNDNRMQQSIPSIKEIQNILVRIGDKTKSFVGSKEWIGSLEIFYVLDILYDVSCKILHVQRHDDIIPNLQKYFEEYGGFVMMGGIVDSASKGIAGIHIGETGSYLLVVDPHFSGVPMSVKDLIEKNYIRWVHINEFCDNKFYNLCLPLLK